MKEKIEINTMIARNVYATESFDFVKLVLKKFCKVETSSKAKEIHKQNKLYDYTDEYRLYGTKDQGIKYHSYYKLLDQDATIPSLYTVFNESYGIDNLWIKFTISSQDGLILELDSKDNSLVEKITSLFEKQFSYCRKQSRDEIFDELIHEIRTKGSADKGKLGIKLGQKAIKIYPDDYWAQFYLGCSFALNGQHKKAIQHLLLAVKRDSKSYDALYNLAKSYLESSKLNEAKETMLKALKLAKKNHAINYYLAVIFEKLGKNDEAKKYYKIAIATAPKKIIVENTGASSFLQQAKLALEKLS